MSPIEHPIVRRFVEDAGNTTQALGVGRVVGQIFAYLYFSEVSRTLDDMKEALGISKGSASMGVRQLEQWGAVQKIWIKGDRKDYYIANDYFGQIVRSIVVDLMGKRLESLSASLDSAEKELNAFTPSPLGGEGRGEGYNGRSNQGKMEMNTLTLSPENTLTLTLSPEGRGNSRSSTPSPSAPSPLGGEGWGEGCNGRSAGGEGWGEGYNGRSAKEEGSGERNSLFLKGRLSRLRDFQEKINKTWNNPIVKKLLK